MLSQQYVTSKLLRQQGTYKSDYNMRALVPIALKVIVCLGPRLLMPQVTDTMKLESGLTL